MNKENKKIEKSCCFTELDLKEEMEPTNRTTNRSPKIKKTLVIRMNRIEGQLRGIRNMIENDCYCDDVLNQISAVTAALNSVRKIILENHIKSCVVEKIKNEEENIVDELIYTISKMMK